MLMAVNEPYALMVQPDDILISPREVDEHFGTMVCFHPRYALGDHHNHMDKDDFLREMYLDTVGHDEAGMKRYERMVNIVSSRFRHIEIEKEKEEKQGQAPARSYGRYNNVFLSDTELSELKAELPDKWEYYIDRLSTHIASKGTKYRSHAATIYKWAQEDEAKKPPKKGIPDYTFKDGESL